MNVLNTLIAIKSKMQTYINIAYVYIGTAFYTLFFALIAVVGVHNPKATTSEYKT